MSNGTGLAKNLNSESLQISLLLKKKDSYIYEGYLLCGYYLLSVHHSMCDL